MTNALTLTEKKDSFRLRISAKKKINPRGYWRKIEHYRKYFCDFAAEMGFDPFKPENWKTITKAQIIAKKV